jgi:hypothetical protein
MFGIPFGAGESLTIPHHRRSAYGDKTDEVYDLARYYLGDLTQTNEIDGTCSTYGRIANGLHYFGGAPERKRLFGRTRPVW